MLKLGKLENIKQKMERLKINILGSMYARQGGQKTCMFGVMSYKFKQCKTTRRSSYYRGSDSTRFVLKQTD